MPVAEVARFRRVLPGLGNFVKLVGGSRDTCSGPVTSAYHQAVTYFLNG